MIELTFGHMSKRPNSTKYTMTNTFTTNVVLKERTNLKSPVFKLNFDPTNYNYCSWTIQERSITRYYWIDDIIFIHNNLWEIHCSLDLLATYRNDILQSQARILYNNDPQFADLYYDDLRFSPSNLDTYSFFGFTDDNSYLHKESFLFGESEFIDLNDGVYILSVISNGSVSGDGAGPHSYMLNTSELKTFMKNLYSFWTGGPFEGASARVEAIRSLQWYPYNKGKLKQKLGSSITQSVIEIAGSIIMDSADILPVPCTCNWVNYITIPREKSKIPMWMNNSRWNTIQLYTPSGYVDLNLDYMYPTNHQALYYSVTMDVIQGDIDVKFLYDAKGGFDDMGGTIAYACSFNWGLDSMWLLERVTDVKQTLWDSITTGGALASAAVTAGVMSSGVSKVKSVGEIVDNREINGLNPKNDIINNLGNNNTNANIGTIIATGIPIPKMSPAINMSSNSGKCGNSLAAMLNTTSLGYVRLRFKPFRCKDLASDSNTTSSYPTPLDKWNHYCKTYGYPCNQFGTLANFINYGTAYIDGTYIVTEGANIIGITPGITDEEIVALNNACNSGIWLR